jgi:thioredoxin-related protein
MTNQAELFVFSSMTCPHCPPVRKVVEEFSSTRKDVVVRSVVSGMSGASELFDKFEVRSVPTIIIKGPGYPHNIGLRGAQDAAVLAKYVDMALGKEPSVEVTSGWSFKKLFQKL